MPEYVCPDCGGAFPEPHKIADQYGRWDGAACPWCERKMEAMYSD